MNQELQDYIKKSKETGLNDEQIKQELLKVGWQEQDINQAFSGTIISTPTPTPVSVLKPASTPKKKNIVDYYLAVLKKYAIFSGRTQRTEYWYFFLANIIIGIILAAIGFMLHDKGILGSLYALIIMIPGIAVTVRRLHDTNRNGGWWFIWLIPFVGAIILLIFTVQDSQPGENKYGSNPKEIKI